MKFLLIIAVSNIFVNLVHAQSNQLGIEHLPETRDNYQKPPQGINIKPSGSEIVKAETSKAWILLNDENFNIHQSAGEDIEAILMFYNKKIRNLKFVWCNRLSSTLEVTNSSSCRSLTGEKYISLDTMIEARDAQNQDSVYWRSLFGVISMILVPAKTPTYAYKAIDFVTKAAKFNKGIKVTSFLVYNGAIFSVYEKIAAKMVETKHVKASKEAIFDYQIEDPIINIGYDDGYEHFTQSLEDLLTESRTYKYQLVPQECKNCVDINVESFMTIKQKPRNWNQSQAAQYGYAMSMQSEETIKTNELAHEASMKLFKADLAKGLRALGDAMQRSLDEDHDSR